MMRREPRCPHRFGFMMEEATSEAMVARARSIEELLLAGHNRIEVPISSTRSIAYEAPRWRRAPIKRARVELARFAHRHGWNYRKVLR